MIQNKYYILSLPEPALNNIFKDCVGAIETQRKSLDGKKYVVKTPENVSIKPQSLNNYQSYTHEEILVILNTPEWKNPIL